MARTSHGPLADPKGRVLGANDPNHSGRPYCLLAAGASGAFGARQRRAPLFRFGVVADVQPPPETPSTFKGGRGTPTATMPPPSPAPA